MTSIAEHQGSTSQLAVPAAIFLPLAAGLSAWAAAGMPVARLFCLVAVGLLTWTFVEYLVHRLLFHLESENPAMQRIVYLYHGRHHDFPSDTRRLTMSPAFTLPVAALFFGLFWLLAGFPAAAPLFAGLALGYLAYETVHFLVHTGQFRRFGLMRQWRRYHLGYHYRDDTVAYGVTTPLWDFVFGTRRP